MTKNVTFTKQGWVIAGATVIIGNDIRRLKLQRRNLFVGSRSLFPLDVLVRQHVNSKLASTLC